MTAVIVQSTPAQRAEQSFEVGYVSEDGGDHRLPLEEAWLVPFESGRPVRRFTARKGQRHLSGLWWSGTTCGRVGYESWPERDHLLALDFDAAVVAIASQPFWLAWADEAGQRVRHAPDYFARRVDGPRSWWTVGRRNGASRGTPRSSTRRRELVNRWAGSTGWSARLIRW